MKNKKEVKNESYFFIQLGKKSNGKIICNEEYKLNELFNGIKVDIPKRPLWQRLLFIGRLDNAARAGVNSAIKAIHSKFKDLIIMDLAKKDFINFLTKIEKGSKKITAKKTNKGRPKGSKNKRK